MKLLSIVFSFRNEEGNIEPLVNRISKTMKEIENWKHKESIKKTKEKRPNLLKKENKE